MRSEYDKRIVVCPFEQIDGDFTRMVETSKHRQPMDNAIAFECPKCGFVALFNQTKFEALIPNEAK